MRTGACAPTRLVLPFYVESEVGPAEALETAAHLSSCAGCAKEADRERALVGALRALPAPEPPRDITSGVMKALRDLRARMVHPAALKWSAIGLLAAAFGLDWLRDDPTGSYSVRILERLGELVNLDGLSSRLSDLLGRLLPAPSHVGDLAAGLVAAFRGGPGVAAPSAAPLFAAVGALLAGLLLACLLAGGLASRPLRALRRLFLPRF